jgi:hypothetical protein
MGGGSTLPSMGTSMGTGSSSTNSALPPISKKGQALQSLKIDLRQGQSKHGSVPKYKSMHGGNGGGSNFYGQEKTKRRNPGGVHHGSKHSSNNYGSHKSRKQQVRLEGWICK